MTDPVVALVGAGSVGSTLAAALVYGGHPFQWVVRNPGRRSELDSLVIQLPNSGQELSLDDTELLGSTEEIQAGLPVIVATKSHQVDQVLASLPDTDQLLVVANGLIKGEHCLGLLYGGAFLMSGVVVTGMENELYLGKPDGGDDPQLFAGLLQSPFMHVEVIDNIRELMWHKLALNCIVNPMTALFDCDNGELLGRLHGPLIQELLREITEVVQGVAESRFRQPSRMELLAEVKQLLQLTRENSSSMREDVKAGRETEVSSLNLAIVEQGRALGIDCPANELISQMILLLAGRKQRRN